MKKSVIFLLSVGLTLTSCSTPAGSPEPVPPGPTTPGIPGTGWGDPSTLTQAQLKTCPLGDSLDTGVIPAGVNACTKGTFNGIITVGNTQKCSLTMDGNGTLTFTSPALTQAITLAPQTGVFYRHEQANGVSTVSYTLENNRYASSGRVTLGFAFYEQMTQVMPNVYISVKVDTQEASCYTRINY